MLELYNDQLLDLLVGHHVNEKDRKKLEIKKDAKGMIFVPGSTVKECPTLADLEECWKVGEGSRHVGSTKMNAGSSRSHLIVSMLIETINKQTGKAAVGKLSLIDLAGSERAGKTGATAERLREAQSINKSLSALGDVISALSSGESFIPYRNNKLTLLMSDSLGGNAKTLMFVNISPADSNIDETRAALGCAPTAGLDAARACAERGAVRRCDPGLDNQKQCRKGEWRGRPQGGRDAAVARRGAQGRARGGGWQRGQGQSGGADAHVHQAGLIATEVPANRCTVLAKTVALKLVVLRYL